MHSEKIQGFQLSPQQKHLWLLQQNNDSQIYRSLCAVEISGNLNLETLNTALKVVIQRHQILRTSFHFLPGMNIPLQVINDVPNGDLLIQNHDLSTIEPHQQQNAIAAIIESAKQRIFDFQQSPLLQISLATLSPSQQVLLLDLPALCADITSLNNLVTEISCAYRACLHGEELTDEPVQYILFSEWQNELLQAPEAEVGKKYWQQQDISHISSLKLPNENQAVGKTGFQPQILTQTIHGELGDKIYSFATNFHISESAFLLTCWQILLWRLTGVSEMIVGTACDGRPEEELQETLGLLARYLPLHCHLESNCKFSQVLEEIALAQTRAYDWQDCFAWEEVLGVDTAITDIPFSPFCFEFTEQSHNSAISEEVSFTLSQTSVYFDRFKVKLSFVRRGDLLIAEFHYDGNLFSIADIQDLAAQYQTLLKSVLQNPQAAINELEILSHEQLQQLLVDFNHTEIDFPQDKCLHQLFEKQVELTPDDIAVVYEHQQLTYAQLNARANQLAHHLQSKGVEPEVLVGICMERSLEMVIALLGVLKAGGAYLPIDPMYPQERVALMVEDAQTPILLTQQRLLEILPQHQGQTICLDADWETIAAEREENPETNVTIDNLAYVIYTSGSTGKPKGAMLPHRAICNHMLWMQAEFPLTSIDKVLQKTPFSFDASVWEFYAPLLVGAQLVMAQPGGHQDKDYLIQVIQEQQITILQLVPTLLRMFLEDEDIPTCTSLKRVFCGGEAFPGELQERFFAHFNADLHNLYGPTETCIDATSWTCQEGINQQIVPIGRPIANTQAYILDSLLRPVPIGVSGELHIGGAGLARGYLNRPELTTNKFISSPFDSSKKLYKTGDLARYLPYGNIEYLGRIDNQVKIRGFRIELGEIEAALTTHPQIQQAVVIATEEISGNKRLVAYVVSEDESLSTNQLCEFLFSQLPEYMVPGVFVILDTLPLTPNGKIDRKALPAPDGKITREHEYVAPRTPNEEIIANIFANILGVENVGIHDKFFDLGGHSLLATQVTSRLKQTFSVELSLRQIFKTPTVATLAEAVTQLQLQHTEDEDEDIADLLVELEGLSDEEVQQLLAQEMQSSVHN